ncbi:MAG: GNAT family N-acetyltransferase [Caldimonas sp.]
MTHRPPLSELEETVVWHGEKIVLRPITGSDEAQHAAFVARLDANDMRMRFFNARRDLSQTELARFTHIDYAREMAFIAVRNADGAAPETLGVVRAVMAADGGETELAIAVRSDVKHDGLGHALMLKMIAYLKHCGVRRVVCDVLRENAGMRELAHSHGFVVDASLYEADTMRLVLTLASDTEPVSSSGH